MWTPVDNPAKPQQQPSRPYAGSPSGAFTARCPDGIIRPCPESRQSGSPSPCRPASSSASTTTDGATASHPAPQQSAPSSNAASPKNLSLSSPPQNLPGLPLPIPGPPAYPRRNPRLPIRLRTPHLIAPSPASKRRLVVNPPSPAPISIQMRRQAIPPSLPILIPSPILRMQPRPTPRRRQIPLHQPNPISP
jgi:hypothetical protein